MSTPRKLSFFKRAACVVAAGVLASSVFATNASPGWIATGYPVAVTQISRITQSSLSLPGGSTQVNITPSSNGVSKMELGNLNISFEIQPGRISPELAMVPDLLTSESIETDLRHAALISVHQVFAPLTVADLKSSPQEVANRIRQSIQDKLDAGYNGKSPYVIQKVELQDACAVKFGMVSPSCTTSFVSSDTIERKLGERVAAQPVVASVRKKM